MRFTNRITPLKKPFQYLLVLLGCLHMAGGPYSLIQVYAWANMLVSYSQDTGIVQATRDTFSGEKPCHLCTKIASNKEVDPEKPTPALPASQLSSKALLQEMIPAKNHHLPPPPSRAWQALSFTVRNVCHGIDADAPPCPPPCSVA